MCEINTFSPRRNDILSYNLLITQIGNNTRITKPPPRANYGVHYTVQVSYCNAIQNDS